MTILRLEKSLKSLREALCVAENAVTHRWGSSHPARAAMSQIIAEIDRQRPLGSDGKHGDRHTPTCGCEVPGQVVERSPIDELMDLRALLDLQWTRMGQATELWRRENPAARARLFPDLGELLDWLMKRGDKATEPRRHLSGWCGDCDAPWDVDSVGPRCPAHGEPLRLAPWTRRHAEWWAAGKLPAE